MMKTRFKELKALFYDLDNTLYPQIDDVRQRIKICVENFFYLHDPWEVENLWLNEWLNNGPKKKVIDIVCDRYKPSHDIQEIISYYRSIRTSLNLDKDVEAFLKALKKKGIIQLVITNGNEATQLHKIKQLGIDNIVDEVIVTKGRWQKPSPYYFHFLLNKYNLRPNDCLSIGDWYATDGVASERAGIQFIYVEGGPIKEQLPLKILKIKKVEQLDEIIDL